jgi:ATP phosphoribosyltransferase regulatory subunit HisZ
VLAEAARVLPRTPVIQQALEATAVARRPCRRAHGFRFDLADLRGYAYYSGMRFGIYTPGRQRRAGARRPLRRGRRRVRPQPARPWASAWTSRNWSGVAAKRR